MLIGEVGADIDSSLMMVGIIIVPLFTLPFRPPTTTEDNWVTPTTFCNSLSWVIDPPGSVFKVGIGPVGAISLMVYVKGSQKF